jgi:hypothetical protein
MLREKLSALLRSCSAQKAGGLPIHGKPRPSHATSPCFSRPETGTCNPALIEQQYRPWDLLHLQPLNCDARDQFSCDVKKERDPNTHLPRRTLLAAPPPSGYAACDFPFLSAESTASRHGVRYYRIAVFPAFAAATLPATRAPAAAAWPTFFRPS